MGSVRCIYASAKALGLAFVKLWGQLVERSGPVFRAESRVASLYRVRADTLCVHLQYAGWITVRLSSRDAAEQIGQ
jgi:hypothetical protein